MSLRRSTRRVPPLQDRLLDKVKRDPVRGCWLFTGSTVKCRNPKVVGYGQMAGADGRVTVAHRISYELFRGPIPNGIMVLHDCDVRNCVNPQHLFLGTGVDNMQDASAKGRTSHGETHHNAILTEADVLVIRRLLIEGVPNSIIAARFHVRINLIQNIRNGKAWVHLGPMNLPRLRRRPASA